MADKIWYLQWLFLMFFFKKKNISFPIYIYMYIRHKLVHNKFKDYHIQVDKCYSFYASKLEP